MFSPRKSILNTESYKPNFGTSRAKNFIRLSANENPLGCSKNVKKVLNNIEFTRYPPQNSIELVEAIANRHKINKNKIILSNGSDELISIIAQAFLEKNDEAIYTEFGFLQFPQAIKIAGGKAIMAKDIEFRVSIENILQKVTKKTKLIFLANPNNPTGTMVKKNEIKKLVEKLPKNILFVYDAAYAEYLDRKDYETGISLVKKHENVIMLRTFSKLHGLAGLRLGWGFCSENLIKILMSVRGPFSVNILAINAGIQAIKDIEFQKFCLNYNKSSIKYIENELEKLNINYQKSFANFVLLELPSKLKDVANKAEKFFSERGILIRNMTVYRLPKYIRVSVGTSEQNKLFIESLKLFLKMQ